MRSEITALQNRVRDLKKRFSRLGEQRADINEEIQQLEGGINRLKAAARTRWAEVPIDTPIEACSADTPRAEDWGMYNFGAYIPKFERPFVTFQNGDTSGEARALKSFKFARLYRQIDIEKYVDFDDGGKFKNFTEGQKVWCEKFGYGRVKRVDNHNTFPVNVDFDTDCSYRSFTVEGYWSLAMESLRRIEKVYE